MSEHHRPDDLEQHLRALGTEIAWPPTPPLVPTLGERRAHGSRRRLVVVALAALALLAAGVLAVSPDARSAFLEVFGIRGATAIRVDDLPQVDPVALDLGAATDRGAAERLAGFELVELPGERPDAILVRDRTVSLVYGPRARPRLVLTQGPGRLWDGLVQKMGGTGTTIEPVEVDGERALFVSGDAHFLLILDEHGQVADEPTALAGTVLLWNDGPRLLRLEGDLTREQALALARSVRTPGG